MTEAIVQPRITIFVSYSRADKEIVDRLRDALEARIDSNIKVLIDRHDIPHGEKWWDVLVDFIHRCDRVIFVVSPDSLKSKACRREIDEIQSVGRRTFPIVVKPVSTSEIPPYLASIQTLSFLAPASFDQQVDTLVLALHQNAEWNRHRRLIDTLADHWAEQKRPKSLLLGADQVDRFNDWLTKRPALEPLLSVNTAAFLDHSNFHCDRDIHFSELLQHQQAVRGFWKLWTSLGVAVAIIAGLLVLAIEPIADFTARVAGWLVSMLALAIAAYWVSRKIMRRKVNALTNLAAKEQLIARYNELEDAQAYIHSLQANEALQRELAILRSRRSGGRSAVKGSNYRSSGWFSSGGGLLSGLGNDGRSSDSNDSGSSSDDRDDDRD